MGATKHWFLQRELRWRVAAAVAWAVLMLPAFTAAYLALARLDPLHPLLWVADTLSELASSHVLFTLTLLSLMLLLVSAFDSRNYTVVALVPCTPLGALAGAVSPHRVLHCAAHTVAGLLAAWCAVLTAGGAYRAPSITCGAQHSPVGECLSERHLFVLLFGGFVGATYSFLYFHSHMYYVPFPAIQMYKYRRFRALLPRILTHSAAQSLRLLRYYCLLYFLLGKWPRGWVMAAFDLHLDSSVSRLDSVSGLLDVPLLYETWLAGAFVLLTWYLSWALLRIFSTEPHVFFVESSFPEEAEMCLPAVLASNPPSIVKHLALQDLSILAQYSPGRRQQIFSLSQPGGRPHTWTMVSSTCLSLLTELAHRLVARQDLPTNQLSKGGLPGPDAPDQACLPGCTPLHMPHAARMRPLVQPLPPSVAGRLGPAQAPSTPADLRLPPSPPFTPDLGGADMGAGGGVGQVGAVMELPLRPQLDLGSPWHGAVQSPHLMRRGPRLWSSTSPVSSLLATPPLPSQSPPQQNTAAPDWLGQKWDQVKNYGSKVWPVSYFVHKLPESSSQALFADCQAHIWALEALSHLVAASITEDRFGVVQTRLSEILNAMLALQDAVDRHFKLPQAPNRPARQAHSLVDSSHKNLRFALRAALKTAVYRVASTFGEHLNSVQVAPEYRRRLQMFLDYKE
uniref:Nucleoporin NDC1 n=1 Tax=Petromyzon marinus TaxID=7757 RepID=A0AAJ7TZ61_PETMA|nr:nucleoporin NDC1 [Petromyzon marinus]